MIEKTDYGGCPMCEKQWKSYSWYVNCTRLTIHAYRNHWPEFIEEYRDNYRAE